MILNDCFCFSSQSLLIFFAVETDLFRIKSSDQTRKTQIPKRIICTVDYGYLGMSG